MLTLIVRPLGFLSTLLFAFSVIAQAQDFGISAEGSFQVFTSKLKDVSDIRVDPSYNYQSWYSNYDGSPYSNVMSNGGGILFERFSPNQHWSVSTGLHYRSITSEINAQETNYFFYRYSQEGLDTRYLRITAITQRVSCIGIPIQARFFPFGGRKVRFYVKLALENNFNIATYGKASFFQSEMNYYEDQVLRSFEQPQSYNAIMSLAGGVRFHGKGKVAGGFEVVGPTGFLTPDAIGMVSPSAGLGFQFNVIYLLKQSNDE